MFVKICVDQASSGSRVVCTQEKENDIGNGDGDAHGDGEDVMIRLMMICVVENDIGIGDGDGDDEDVMIRLMMVGSCK